MRRFIFITGPSGSGKSAVGKILAQTWIRIFRYRRNNKADFW